MPRPVFGIFNFEAVSFSHSKLLQCANTCIGICMILAIADNTIVHIPYFSLAFQLAGDELC